MERPADHPVTFTTAEVIAVLFRAITEAEDALAEDHPARRHTAAATALIIERLFGTEPE